MANKNIKKYAKDFTSETGRAAGSLPKTPRIKTIITKALTHKTELTPKEKKKLEKFFGKKFETDEIDHELMIAAGLIKRAYFDDSSLKLLYDLKGEKIVGENTENPLNLNINLGDAVSEALSKIAQNVSKPE